MNYTTKDKLTALLLHRTAKESVADLPQSMKSQAIKNLLILAISYEENGLDFSVIDELEYV